MSGDNYMKYARYILFSTNPDEKLTKEELEDGWHFCPDWDDMLIHKEWPEIESCTCKLGDGHESRR